MVQEKKIKDFVHLYLGCKCICKVEASPFGNTKYRLDAVSSDSVRVFYDADDMWWVKPETIKPILRPLSDMSEEEQTVVQFRDIGSFKRYINEEVWTFEHCRYLLSKHFDLFNLIPEGLAIDKTTLNQQ